MKNRQISCEQFWSEKNWTITGLWPKEACRQRSPGKFLTTTTSPDWWRRLSISTRGWQNVARSTLFSNAMAFNTIYVTWVPVFHFRRVCHQIYFIFWLFFQFGLFSSGLGYFTSMYDESGNKDTSDEANLPATAGLELIVFGVHIRPLYMFTSQGQLMGHIWAGTGTDRTPIFQVCTY